MVNISALGLGIFFAIIIVIAVYYRRWAESVESYIVAKRAQSPWWNGLALTATYTSAWGILGGPAICYVYGIIDFVSFIAWGAGVFLFIWYYVPKIRELGAKYGAVGLASFMELHYGKRYVGIIIGILGWYAMLLYVVGITKGIGLIISSAMGLDYATSVVLGKIMALIYLIAAGLKGVIIVDVLMCFMAIAMWTACLYLLFALGGGNILNTVQVMNSFDPKLLHPTGPPYASDPISLWILGFITFFMWQFLPHTWQNYLALRSTRKRDIAIFAALGPLSGALATWALMMGAAARVFLPYKVTPDVVTIEVFKYFLSPLLPLLLIGAFSIAMSTADSVILGASTDLYWALKEVVRPLEKKIGSVNVVRLIILITTILICYFAIFYMPEFMVYVMILGGLGFACALTGPTAIGIVWGRRDPLAAVISTILSLVISQILAVFWNVQWLVACFIGLVLSVIIYVIIAIIRAR
jgi:Na+/proline symporter